MSKEAERAALGAPSESRRLPDRLRKRLRATDLFHAFSRHLRGLVLRNAGTLRDRCIVRCGLK